jgi:hypothetical protein
MPRNAAVRTRRGHGDWIGHTDIWTDPRAQLPTNAATPQATPATVQTQPMATAKQLSYLKALFEQRKHLATVAAIRTHLLGEYKAGKLTRKMASEAIGDLLAIRP